MAKIPLFLPLLLIVKFPMPIFALNLTQIGHITYRIKLGALWNLEQMSWCRLGLSAGLAFNGYGCWCGHGGSGDIVDGIDACCLQHDLCYDWVLSNGNSSQCQSTLGEYVSQYNWNCTDGSQGNSPTINCADESNQGCGQRICRCDQQLVNCWATLPVPQCKKQCKTKGCPYTVAAQNVTIGGNDFFGIVGGMVDKTLRQIGNITNKLKNATDKLVNQEEIGHIFLI